MVGKGVENEERKKIKTLSLRRGGKKFTFL